MEKCTKITIPEKKSLLRFIKLLGPCRQAIQTPVLTSQNLKTTICFNKNLIKKEISDPTPTRLAWDNNTIASSELLEARYHKLSDELVGE